MISIKKSNGNMIYYIRDSENNVIGFIYNGETYYYKKNIQQDVIGIYDSTFNQIVTYTYDSWGNIISIVDTSENNIGTINPYRYRSYYYDNETELYYLNTRYYNPKWKRFINADGIIGANDCITNSNLYFYANNNPIIYSDSDGNFSMLGILGAVTAIVTLTNCLSNSISMFARSIFYKPKRAVFDNNSSLAKTVKKTNVMKKEVRNNINRYSKKGPRRNKTQMFSGEEGVDGIYFNENSSISDIDAKYSIGHAKYEMYITEVYTNTGVEYDVKVHVHDTYDFHKVQVDSVKNAINFIGYTGQEIGIVKNYGWDLYFYMNIKESELS